MTVKLKIGVPYPSVPTPPSLPFRRKLTSQARLFDVAESSRNLKVVKSWLLRQEHFVNKIVSNRQCSLFAIAEGQESEEHDMDRDSEPDQQDSSADGSTSPVISYNHIDGALGKPGFISFYGVTKRRDDQIPVPSSEKNPNYLMWFVGPTILVTSFVFPSLYLRRIVSTIFEDSLLTDFLILFFTEAVFYCGVAVFLLLIDRQQRLVVPITRVTSQKVAPPLGYRISSGAILLLSIIIPTITMGFVWPWTGPAASATLSPYLVGIAIQFAFEEYAKSISSPSLPAIPVIFQVYRLHQLNRAAQLVTALSFTIKGAEVTAHNLAISKSLTTLLNVLQFLGIVCLWSLSSFIMRCFSSTVTPNQHVSFL